MAIRQSAATAWHEFWHRPIAAERLTLLKWATCLALLTDITVQQLPWFTDLFGERSLLQHGFSDAASLRSWRWTAYFFAPSGEEVLLCFVVWVALLIAYALGLWPRVIAVCVWLFSMAMLNRHYHLKNFGDSVLRVSLFLLMFAPSPHALSWHPARATKSLTPTYHPPWLIRLFQIQLCTVYCCTGIAKLIGPLSSTWYQGTSLHYALNDFGLARFGPALLPLPLWVTAPLSYAVLFWEVAFVPLILFERTRRWALIFGITFHLATFVLLEIGWFAFYILAWYCAWIPDQWFTRVFYPRLWKWFPRLAP